jgi:coenzyme F420-reducing hydrogenase beta subunit
MMQGARVDETVTIDREIQPYLATYAGFAADPADRERVAAGGLVTSLLTSALTDGQVDGAVLGKASFAGGKLGYDIDIVTTPEAVHAYGKSAYFNIPIEREWKRIEAFPGKLAIVALPCQVRILRKAQSQGRLQNVALVVSLFCGHNNEVELWDLVLEKRGIDQSRIIDVRTDRDYMRGAITFTLDDGSHKFVKFREFNTYRRLWLFAKDLCRHCDEHLGAGADLSVGDIFIKRFLNKDVRHSALIVRSAAGDAIVRRAIERGRVMLENVTAAEIYAAQKSILDPSRESVSRYYANRFYGHKAKKPVSGRFRLSSYLLYLLLMGNDRLSRTNFGRKLFAATPMPVLYAYIKVLNFLKRRVGQPQDDPTPPFRADKVEA